MCSLQRLSRQSIVSDLTSEAFIACLRRFVARCDKPHTIFWSDHGSNFVGASRELAELAAFLEEQRTQTDIPDFCASQSIRWTSFPSVHRTSVVSGNQQSRV